MNNSISNPVETAPFETEQNVSRANTITTFCLNLFEGSLPGDCHFRYGMSEIDRLMIIRDNDLLNNTGNTDFAAIDSITRPGIGEDGIYRRRIGMRHPVDTPQASIITARLGRDCRGRELVAALYCGMNSGFELSGENRDHLAVAEIKRYYQALSQSKSIARALTDQTRFHFVVDNNSKVVWSRLPKRSFDPEAIQRAEDTLIRLSEKELSEGDDHTLDKLQIAHLSILGNRFRVISFDFREKIHSVKGSLDEAFIKFFTQRLRNNLDSILNSVEQINLGTINLQNTRLINQIKNDAARMKTILNQTTGFATTVRTNQPIGDF